MKRFLPLLLLVMAFQGIGAVLGIMTKPEIDSWYDTLVKSPFSPPDYLFGIVWPILYLALAIAIWMVWKREESPHRKSILRIFAAHMVLNWAWTPAFFVAHNPAAGLITLVLIVTTALLLFKMLWNYERRAAWLLVPYIAWVSFAMHLNHYIWQHYP